MKTIRFIIVAFWVTQASYLYSASAKFEYLASYRENDISHQEWITGNGVTFDCNCWGYALGYTCWVDDPEYIYADNYDPAPTYPTSIPQGEMVVKKSGHVQKLTDLSMSFPPYGPPIYLKKETVEKNRDSGIYTQYWSGTGTPVYSVYIKK